MIPFDSGKNYEFHWCGMKKHREAGVRFLIRVDPNIIVNKTNFFDPQIIAINLKVYGFNIKTCECILTYRIR